MLDFAPYQSQVLFLLIGANPLPNYVAASLLAKPHGTLYLLPSEGENSQTNTYEVAERLQAVLARPQCRPDLTICIRGIPRTDPHLITCRVKTLLHELSPGSDVGLNYTGGTKPMATHVYHTLRVAYPNGCFSYLDATSLQMVISREGTPLQSVPVGRAVDLDFATLFALHGYEIGDRRQEPRHAELYHAIARVCATAEGFRAWKGWLKGGRPLVDLPRRQEHPLLKPIIDVFETWGDTPQQVAHHLGLTSLDSCHTWFNGTWLEEYTLECLHAAAEQLNITRIGIDLKPRPVIRSEKVKPRNLQLDVAAIIGYQLFAISCIASEQNGGETKRHLFEAYVRAQQLGGDEARTGLICCVANPAFLEAEVEVIWDAEGRIRIFGRDQLPDLAAWLEDWFQTANKEA